MAASVLLTSKTCQHRRPEELTRERCATKPRQMLTPQRIKVSAGKRRTREHTASFTSLAQLSPLSVLQDVQQTRPFCPGRAPSAPANPHLPRLLRPPPSRPPEETPPGATTESSAAAPSGARAAGPGPRYLGVLLRQLLVLPLQLRRRRRHLRPAASAALGSARPDSAPLGFTRVRSGAPAGPARPRMGRRTSGFREEETR